MLQSDITYQQKLNELMLDVRHPNSKGIVFILVEGDSDIKFYRKLFSTKKCKIEKIPGGKGKVKECVDTILLLYKLIIGIEDADFRNLDSTYLPNSHIFITDYHDMEMTIIANDSVLDAIIKEHANVTTEDINTIRNNLLILLSKISYLKWLNDREVLELSFRSSFFDLIQSTPLGLDFDIYFYRVISKSPNAKIKDIDVINEKIEKLKLLNPDLMQLCNGHDFMCSFLFYLNQNGCKGYSADDISSMCRIACTIEDFKRTILYKDILTWANNNSCQVYDL